MSGARYSTEATIKIFINVLILVFTTLLYNKWSLREFYRPQTWGQASTPGSLPAFMDFNSRWKHTMLNYARGGKAKGTMKGIYFNGYIIQDPSLMFNLPWVGFVFVCRVFVCLVEVFKLSDVSNCRVIGISVVPGHYSLATRPALGIITQLASPPHDQPLSRCEEPKSPYAPNPYMQRSGEDEYSLDLGCCVILSWTF